MHPAGVIVITFTLTALALKCATPGLSWGGKNLDKLVEPKQTTIEKIESGMKMPHDIFIRHTGKPILLIPEF
jgi:hypothetical protein